MKKSLLTALIVLCYFFFHSSFGYITSLQLISPPDLAQTLNTTPYFKFKAISNTSSTLSCTLYINSTPYGTDNSVYNDTETVIQANSSLSEGYDYVWWINCSDNESSVESEKRIIGIGANFSRCAVLVDSNANYYLVGDIVDSSASVCIDIRANSITLDCKEHLIDGVTNIRSIGIKTNSSYNILKNCEVFHWGTGIFLNGNYNYIKSCEVIQNNIGIYLLGDKNSIYNNIFNNTINVRFSGNITPNTWNMNKTNVTNILGYWYIAGNYWAKPDGSGYSEICKDEDYDGICDNAYDVIYDRECGVGTGYACSNNTDYLPLTIPKILKISFVYNSSVGNNLKEYGKNSLLKYVYALFSNYLSSFVFESGRLFEFFENEKNISMWVTPYSRVYFVVTKNISKERFEKRVEMVRDRKFLSYGRFNFGYELGKKFLVRVILSYDRMIFEGTKILEKGVYRLMIRNIGKNNENVVIKLS